MKHPTCIASCKAWLEIDLDTIVSNVQAMQKTIHPAKLLAVVKAGSYGLGFSIPRTLAQTCHVNRFGVATLEEALELLPLQKEIQILGDILPFEIKPAIQNNIIIPITSLQQAKNINSVAATLHKTAQCHILVDTGMGRLGIPIRNAFEEIKLIVTLPHISCVGLYSHLPCSGTKPQEQEFTKKQVEITKELLTKLRDVQITFKETHIANSGAISHFPEAYNTHYFNYVRTGINITGAYADYRNNTPLKEAISFRTRLISFRKFYKGETIGYDNTYTLKKDQYVGIISAGYADGMPLALSNKGRVLYQGQSCPILGRLSMDYTAIDLSNIPPEKLTRGDIVTLLGQDGEQSILIKEWEKIANIHAYNVITGITPRTKRFYIRNGELFDD